MAGNRKSTLPPRHLEGADLVVKQSWKCSSRFGMWFAPSLELLGTRAGFLWLSKYFGWMANSIDEGARFDNDIHAHLEYDGPFNGKLSDVLGLKLVSLPTKHRRRILRSLGITQKARLSGSPVVQFTRVLRSLTDAAERLNEEDRSRLCMEIRELIADAEANLGVLEGTLGDKG